MITVSARLILTAFNSSSYGWLTKCQFLQDLMRHLKSAYMKREYGWAGVRSVITKFPRMDSLLNLLTHGAPLARALRARENSAISNKVKKAGQKR